MSSKLHLFDAFGIELEYMLVDRDSLAVKPICDTVIQALSGEILNEISLGRVNVSNELVLHVIEFKGNGPQKDLVRLQASFQDEVERMNEVLMNWNACLLPTAMHPFMNPLTDTKIWPHGQNSIYETYNRIFNCQGHGWSNLQSVHINLPFANDEEFARLHAAIRIVLPLLPGLAASSPMVEGKLTGILDNRLHYYSQNQKRIPSIIGDIIPEAVFSKRDYEQVILEKIQNDIRPLDPDRELEGEWLNSRGAIARFERNAIEIRVLDIQECLPADFAVISLVISLVKSLVDERWISFEEQKAVGEQALRQVFMDALRSGCQTRISDELLLNCFKITAEVSMQELWQRVSAQLIQERYLVERFSTATDVLLQRGTLAHRLTQNLSGKPSKQNMMETWKQLADCLHTGRFYV